MERLQIDLIDLRASSDANDGFSWILHIVDMYFRYSKAHHVKSKSADDVVKHMRHVFETETAPRFVQSDNGKEFKNKKIAELYTEFNVNAIHGHPRHPKSQGMVERANQALVRRLGKTLLASGSKRWIDILSRAKYGINIGVHRPLKSGLLKPSVCCQ